MTSLQPHHDHAGHAHGDLMETARCAAARAGEQWTPMRAEVLNVLDQAARPTSAYDLAEAVSARMGRRIAANTVYRILDLLVQLDVVRRVESRNAYAVCAHLDRSHDCIFLVCDSCGKAQEVMDESLSSHLQLLVASRCFQPSRPVIEINGLCSACIGLVPAKG